MVLYNGNLPQFLFNWENGNVAVFGKQIDEKLTERISLRWKRSICTWIILNIRNASISLCEFARII